MRNLRRRQRLQHRRLLRLWHLLLQRKLLPLHRSQNRRVNRLNSKLDRPDLAPLLVPLAELLKAWALSDNQALLVCKRRTLLALANPASHLSVCQVKQLTPPARLARNSILDFLFKAQVLRRIPMHQLSPLPHCQATTTGKIWAPVLPLSVV